VREYVALVCKVRVDVALVMGDPFVPNCEVVKAAYGRDGPLRCNLFTAVRKLRSSPAQKSGLSATGMWYSNKWVLFSAQDSSSIGCCTRR
jgi:hypothetical protein